MHVSRPAHDHHVVVVGVSLVADRGFVDSVPRGEFGWEAVGGLGETDGGAEHQIHYIVSVNLIVQVEPLHAEIALAGLVDVTCEVEAHFVEERVEHSPNASLRSVEAVAIDGGDALIDVSPSVRPGLQCLHLLQEAAARAPLATDHNSIRQMGTILLALGVHEPLKNAVRVALLPLNESHYCHYSTTEVLSTEVLHHYLLPAAVLLHVHEAGHHATG